MPPRRRPRTVSPAPAALHRALLPWFRRERRDLPWRRTRDPYAVWLSEVMLQQTQVATVLPYWERFLGRFPTVFALAAAPQSEVLALWSGLGYYARARHLHRAAQALVEHHGGVFPADLAALEALPGFGPYTAAAVGSLALGLDAALVDGNVARVLCRLHGWALDADAARAVAWERAPALVPAGRAGEWNEALMELGATVCTPQTPRCKAPRPPGEPPCPLTSLCLASTAADPALYPLPKKRAPRRPLALVAAAIRRREAILLAPRAGDRLFGGLWELPFVETANPEAEPGLSRLTAALISGKATVTPLGTVCRTLTHRTLTVELVALSGRVRPPAGARFVRPDELNQLGLSSLTLELLERAGVPLPADVGRRTRRS